MKTYIWTCLACGHTYQSKRFDAPCPECGGTRAISANAEHEDRTEVEVGRD